jgi:hypothetical protein
MAASTTASWSAAIAVALHTPNLDKEQWEGLSSQPLHQIEHGRDMRGISPAAAASAECSGARASRVTLWVKKMEGKMSANRCLYARKGAGRQALKIDAMAGHCAGVGRMT